MNNKIIIGLVFTLSFSMLIGSSHSALSQTIQCNAHSTLHVNNGIAVCTCDTGFVTAQNSNPVRPLCFSPVVVGGMGIPIDSTALLLAGVQGSALWMIPAIVIAGVGIGIVSLRRSKNKQD